MYIVSIYICISKCTYMYVLCVHIDKHWKHTKNQSRLEVKASADARIKAIQVEPGVPCRARFMGPVVAIVFSMGKRGVKTMGKTMMNIPVLLKIHGFDLYPNIWEFIYHEKSMSFFGTLICFKGGFSFDHRTWRLNQPRFGFNRPTCRPNQSKLEDYINHIETTNIWIFFLMCFYEVDSDWVCLVRCGMSQDCKTIKSSIVKSFKSLGMHGS